MCEPVTNTVCTEVESAPICKQVEKVTINFYFTIEITITIQKIKITNTKLQLKNYNQKITIKK